VCIPPGVQADRIVDQIAANIIDIVDRSVLAQIPDNITFTDANLRTTLAQAGAGENIDLIDDVREIIRDGWSYTDGDLRDDINREWGAEAVELLDDARAFLAEGWTYTEADFRDHIVDLAAGLEMGEENILENFDRGRTLFNRVRTYKLLIYLPAFLVLLAIGFLGGRSWTSRLAWAAVFLVVTSGIIYIAFGPVYQYAGEFGLDSARETTLNEIEFDSEFEATERLVTFKAFDMVESIVGDFAGGIATKSLVPLVAGLIALVVALAWTEIKLLARRMRRRPPAEPLPTGYSS
jgi:hypothetical protein